MREINNISVHRPRAATQKSSTSWHGRFA